MSTRTQVSYEDRVRRGEALARMAANNECGEWSMDQRECMAAYYLHRKNQSCPGSRSLATRVLLPATKVCMAIALFAAAMVLFAELGRAG